MAGRVTLVAMMLVLPVFLMAAAVPTAADAKAFMDRAEAELLKAGTLQQRAQWVQETYITDDTDLLACQPERAADSPDD